MEIKIITDNNIEMIWNQFVTENTSPSSFLQSWQWGEFRREKLDAKIKRLAIYDRDELIAVAQFVNEPLPLGKFYWSCPRGPVIKIRNPKSEIINNEKIINLIINELGKTAKEEKVVFIRMELPDNKNDLQNKEWIPDPPPRRGKRVGNDKIREPKILVHSINPANSLLLDLTKSEAEIFASMHQKTRYNIRLAEKKGIKIAKKQETIIKQDIECFYKILQQTARRDKIKIFNKNYYENLINYFSLLPITHYTLHVTIFFAEYNNKILSAIMMVGFGDTATYLHGGSLNEGRELMPNHALQWAAIKWAKEQGYKWYDFWGVAPKVTSDKGQATSDWAGITRFKTGFVGQNTRKEINYFGAQDYVLNKKWYNLYQLAKIFKI
ncbi:MAG TPA: peptidoglycan bridge formation glycyltransferase FemA/FemB family protein [bacterium]|nr:peptidoglycan bridge formation glycyltransferase FemA/FemB family protein [bacterium]HPL95434.1 peptidoglycan bridge formation glycyltransferase FemA/FemB family protein [bacterium]